MIQAGLDYSMDWNERPVSKPQQQVKKVKKIYKTTNRARMLFFKIAAMLFLYAAFLVYLCIVSSSMGYQLVELENQVAQMENANLQAEYEIAQCSSLERIEASAIAFGMHKPEESIYIAANIPVVKPEMVTVEEGSAGTAYNADKPLAKPLGKLFSGLQQLAGVTINN